MSGGLTILEIRKIREDENEIAYYLGAQAFMFGEIDKSWQTDPNRHAGEHFGVWDESGLQAKVFVIPFEVYMGSDLKAPMGGVAGVACLPASRGKGYAGTCLKYSLEQMREAGQFTSMLFPFSWDFYRKLGYEWIGQKRTYNIPTKVMQSSPETKFVRAATQEDRPRIEAAHAKFAIGYRGEIVRSAKIWNRILDNTEKNYNYAYLYERDGDIEGYLTYRGGKSSETHLREFVALTPRAQSGLLGLLKRCEMQIDKFVWDAPENDLLWSQFYHWDIETSIQPCLMGRIVDVKMAFEALKSGAVSGSVVLEIVDETCPWNTGKWRIAIEDEKIEVTASRDSAEVSMDIQAISQAYFGSPSLGTLKTARRIAVHNDGGFKTLEALLSGPPVWNNVHF